MVAILEMILMHNNLTGTVAINLTQTGWLPYVIALVGPLSAFIGAAAVLATTWLQQRIQRKEMRREERKQAYIKLIGATNIMGMAIQPADSAANFAKGFVEVELVGSTVVTNKIKELGINPTSMWQNTTRIRDALVPLMEKELQN
jgi:hypothetical protein